jgi:Uma2 family endonuclease
MGSKLAMSVEEYLRMIPDVAVFRNRVPPGRYPSTPPLIAIEIVSPEDRHSDVLEKLSEYETWGVKHIWLVDPRVERSAFTSRATLGR